MDGTLGGGGHALEVCRRLGEYGRLIGIDQDADAIAAASERLRDYEDRVTIVRSNYEEIQSVLKDLQESKRQTVFIWTLEYLYQLDTPERGFTTGRTTPLDMRWIREHTDGRLCEYVQRV